MPIRMNSLYDRMTIYNTHYPVEGDVDYVVNRYGDPQPVESAGVVVPCIVEPYREPIENLTAQDRRTMRYIAIVPENTVVDSLARVHWNGQDYAVWGQPSPRPSRHGYNHITFLMQITEGA